MRKFGKKARNFECLVNPNGCARINKRDMDNDSFLPYGRVLNVIEPDGSKRKYMYCKDPITGEVTLLDANMKLEPSNPIARGRDYGDCCEDYEDLEGYEDTDDYEFEDNLKQMLDYFDEHEDEFEGLDPEEICAKAEREVIGCKKRVKSTLYWLKAMEKYCLTSPHADEIGVTEIYPMVREAINAYLDKQAFLRRYRSDDI